MPELAAMIAVGSTFSILTGVIIYILELRKYKSSEFVVLEKNLKKIGKRWNDLNKSIDDFTVDGKKSEVNKQINTVLTITFVATLLSWLGFFFYVLIFVSIKKLGRNRFSDKIFESDLTHKELSIPEIQHIVEQISK